MTLTWHETWTAIIAICVVGAIYLGGEALRDEFKVSDKKPWRWGDAQRHGSEEVTWGTHLVMAPIFLFIAGLSIRLILRW